MHEGRVRRLLLPLCLALLTGAALAQDQDQDQDRAWTETLRPNLFGERPITESEAVIALHAPRRAEDAAFVPIRIESKIPQQPQRYIRTIRLVADHNPVPLVGTFHFGPQNGRADLSLHIRVDGYGMVRAIAETNDGRLYMSSRFVKASGGCSAPAIDNAATARTHLGRIRVRLPDARSGAAVPIRVSITHPNTTGLQRDPLTHLFIAPHFVREVRVGLDGTQVFAAETNISVSENPSFRFYLRPGQDARELRIHAVDSEGAQFDHVEQLGSAWHTATAH